jgi:hypothetical protein
MPRYRYTGQVRVSVPDARVEVDPGEEFDSDVELNNPYFDLVEPAPEVTPEEAPAS